MSFVLINIILTTLILSSVLASGVLSKDIKIDYPGIKNLASKGDLGNTFVNISELRGFFNGSGYILLTKQQDGQFKRKDFLTLISNTKNCWTECKTVYSIKNPTIYDLNITNESFKLQLFNVTLDLNAGNTNIFIKRNVSELVPTIIKTVVNYTIEEISNITNQTENVTKYNTSYSTIDINTTFEREFALQYGGTIKSGDETQLIIRSSLSLGSSADNVVTYAGLKYPEYAEWYANADRIYSVNLSVGSAVTSNITTAIIDLDMSNTTIFNSSASVYMAKNDSSGNLTQIHSEISGYGTAGGKVYFLIQQNIANDTNLLENYTIVVGQLGQPLRTWRYIFFDGSNFTGAEGYTSISGNGSIFTQLKVGDGTEYSDWRNKTTTPSGTVIEQVARDDQTLDRACFYSTKTFTLDAIRYDYELGFLQTANFFSTTAAAQSVWGLANATAIATAGNCDVLSSVAVDGVFFTDTIEGAGRTVRTFKDGTATDSANIVTEANMKQGDRHYYTLNITSNGSNTDPITANMEDRSGNGSAVNGTKINISFLNPNIPQAKVLRLTFSTWGVGPPQHNVSTGAITLMIFPQNRTTAYVGGGSSLLGSDSTAPVITLRNPPDATSNSTRTHQFVLNISDATGITNATLYHNISGSWAANQTNSSINGNNSVNVTFTVSNIAVGGYVWNVRSCDNASTPNCGFASSNFTLTVTNPLRIDGNGTIPENVTFTNNTNNLAVFANVTSPGNSITWVNFSLTAPNGTAVINNQNGTIQGSNNSNWRSASSYNLTLTEPDLGNWSWNFTGGDSLGNTVSGSGSFRLINNITVIGNVTQLGRGYFGSNWSFSAQVSGDENFNNISNVSFILHWPNGTIMYDVNGSANLSGTNNTWNSPGRNLSVPGTYTYQVNATNNYGGTATSRNTFVVNDTITVTPDDYFTALNIEGQTLTFNVTAYHDSVENFTFSLNVTNALDTTYFTMHVIAPNRTAINGTINNATDPYNFRVQINTTGGIPDGYYLGNLTLYRHYDNGSTIFQRVIPITLGVNPPAGIITLRNTSSGDIENSTCSVTQGNCDLIASFNQKDTIYQTWRLNNTGGYNLSNCNALVLNNSGRSENIPGIGLSIASSAIAPNESSLVTLQGELSTIGFYSRRLDIQCNATALGFPERLFSHAEQVPLVILSVNNPITGGGFGASSSVASGSKPTLKSVPTITTTANVTIPTFTSSCGDSFCSADENGLACTKDCVTFNRIKNGTIFKDSKLMLGMIVLLLAIFTINSFTKKQKKKIEDDD